MKIKISLVLVLFLTSINIVIADSNTKTSNNAEEVFNAFCNGLEANGVKIEKTEYRKKISISGSKLDALKPKKDRNYDGLIYSSSIGKTIKEIPQFNIKVTESTFSVESDMQHNVHSLHLKIMKNSLSSKKAFILLMSMMNPATNPKMEWSTAFDKILQLPDTDLETKSIAFLKHPVVNFYYSTISADFVDVTVKKKVQNN